MKKMPTWTTVPEGERERSEQHATSWKVWQRLPVVGMGLLWFAGAVYDAINFSADDMYTSLRYAENAAHGYGLVYNIGEHVEGYSNFLWTVLLAGGARMGFDQAHGQLSLVIFAKILGAVFGALTIVAAAWLFRSASETHVHRSSPMIAVAVLGIPAAMMFDAWSISGMETPLCAFLVTIASAAMCVLLDGSSDVRRARYAVGISGVSFALCAMTRPEQIFIWALTTLCLVLTLRGRIRSLVLGSAAITVVLLIPFFAWRLSYYGFWLPNTVYAKTSENFHAWISGLRQGGAGVISIAGPLSLGLIAIVPGAVKNARVRFLLFLVGSQLLFMIGSGGDWMPGYRLLIPIVAVLSVLAALGLQNVVERLRLHVRADVVVLAIVVLLLFNFASTRAFVMAQSNYVPAYSGVAWIENPDLLSNCRRVKEIVPPSSLFATSECGGLGYFNMDLRIMDICGLMDSTISHMPGLHSEKMTPEYFLSRNPDFFMMSTAGSGPSLSDGRIPGHRDALDLYNNAIFRQRYWVIAYLPGLVLFKKVN